MKDTDWRILHELYHYRNITKAASALYITQPALTKRIQIMEQEFGVQIVMRGKYGVIFTSAGEYLAKCAEKQVQFMDEIRHKLDYLQNSQKGTLIVGTSYSFSRFQLPVLLKQYRKLFPEVEIEMACVKSNKLAHMVEVGQVDVAFVRGEYEGEAERMKLSDEIGYVLCREPVDLKRLPELGQIAYDIGTSSQQRIEEWWNLHYDRPARITMTTSFIDSAWQMVREGLGYTICFLSEEMVEGLELWRCPMLDGQGQAVRRATYFLYQDVDGAADYVKGFIQMVGDGIFPLDGKGMRDSAL